MLTEEPCFSPLGSKQSQRTSTSKSPCNPWNTKHSSLAASMSDFCFLSHFSFYLCSSALPADKIYEIFNYSIASTFWQHPIKNKPACKLSTQGQKPIVGSLPPSPPPHTLFPHGVHSSFLQWVRKINSICSITGVPDSLLMKELKKIYIHMYVIWNISIQYSYYSFWCLICPNFVSKTSF